jgi:hypothetical protein
MSEVADNRVNDVPGEDWATLAQALVDRFPGVAAGEVVENLTRNRRAVEDFSVAESEQRETVELMTRYQLMQLTGEVPDNARYKPEQHIPRIREPGDSFGDS